MSITLLRRICAGASPTRVSQSVWHAKSPSHRRIQYPAHIQHVHPGDDFTALTSALKEALPAAPQDMLGLLTPSQTRVVERVARGETNAEIAAALVVTVGTVKRHLHDIYHALGVRSRGEAAYMVRVAETARH
ncbi:helix-turn-helix transcriptional regulator [Microbacterium paulum]|uniref:helix-turn-helix transcriptional regulator n=1 Tax=Microbacterium paulum TaxID=2707006 RepID=UPI00308437FA